jgi:hypothetical protein
MATDDSRDRVRLAALNALCGSRSRLAVATFRRFLRNPGPALRLAALRGLAATDVRLPSPAEITLALEDDDASVRKAAATIAGSRAKLAHAPAAFQALAFALRDPDETVRIAVVEALASLGDHRAVLPLIRASSDASPLMRSAAERSLREILGSEIDSVGAGLAPEQRSAALKEWWTAARVDIALGRRTKRAEPRSEVPEPVLAPISEVTPPPAPDILIPESSFPVPHTETLESLPTDAAATSDEGESTESFESLFGDVEADVQQPSAQVAEEVEESAEGEEYENIFGSENE